MYLLFASTESTSRPMREKKENDQSRYLRICSSRRKSDYYSFCFTVSNKWLESLLLLMTHTRGIPIIIDFIAVECEIKSTGNRIKKASQLGNNGHFWIFLSASHSCAATQDQYWFSSNTWMDIDLGQRENATKWQSAAAADKGAYPFDLLSLRLWNVLNSSHLRGLSGCSASVSVVASESTAIYVFIGAGCCIEIKANTSQKCIFMSSWQKND